MELLLVEMPGSLWGPVQFTRSYWVLCTTITTKRVSGNPQQSSHPLQEKVWAHPRKQAGMSQVNGFKRHSHTPAV